jgi:hypothetical protein
MSKETAIIYIEDQLIGIELANLTKAEELINFIFNITIQEELKIKCVIKNEKGEILKDSNGLKGTFYHKVPSLGSVGKE